MSVLVCLLLFLTTVSTNAQSLNQGGLAAQKDENIGADNEDVNPLGFTVNDIQRTCTNVQEPQILQQHSEWMTYKAEQNGVPVTFWVKNNFVYSVSFRTKGTIGKEAVERMLLPYVKGSQWNDAGTGTIAIKHEWMRTDKKAWCEALTQDQQNFDGVTVKTKTYNQLMSDMMKSSLGR